MFFWGASTSAYQVEGGNVNNWSKWEKENATKLAAKWKKIVEAGGGQTILKETVPARNFEGKYDKPQNYICGTACNYRETYKTDLKILPKLNLNAYRFSVEWSRLIPKRGEINTTELDYYLDQIKTIKSLGVTPFLTLWHFTEPCWFFDLGSWSSSKAVPAFLEYVETVAKVVGNKVQYWLVFNEPRAFAFSTYLLGEYPNRGISVINLVKALRNFVKAYKEAVRIIKRYNPGAKVSLTTNTAAIKNNRTLNYIWNHLYFDSFAPFVDFVAVTCYRTINSDKKTLPVSDLGWKLDPDSLYDVVKVYRNLNLPIIVIEHGLADGADQLRSWYIEKGLEALFKARDEGINVVGYFHWSFMDNFEWNKGYWPRFGLIKIGYKTQRRVLRRSAYHFRDLIAKYNNRYNLQNTHQSSILPSREVV